MSWIDDHTPWTMELRDSVLKRTAFINIAYIYHKSTLVYLTEKYTVINTTPRTWQNIDFFLSHRGLMPAYGVNELGIQCLRIAHRAPRNTIHSQ